MQIGLSELHHQWWKEVKKTILTNLAWWCLYASISYSSIGPNDGFVPIRSEAISLNQFWPLVD